MKSQQNELDAIYQQLLYFVKMKVHAGFHATDAAIDTSKYQWVGDGYNCMIKGLSMMTRKDSKLALWWDPAFRRVKEKGTYDKICKEAPKKHSMCTYNNN